MATSIEVLCSIAWHSWTEAQDEREKEESLAHPFFSGIFAWVSACHNFALVCAPCAQNDFFLEQSHLQCLGWVISFTYKQLCLSWQQRKKINSGMGEMALSLLQLESFMNVVDRENVLCLDWRRLRQINCVHHTTLQPQWTNVKLQHHSCTSPDVELSCYVARTWCLFITCRLSSFAVLSDIALHCWPPCLHSACMLG